MIDKVSGVSQSLSEFSESFLSQSGSVDSTPFVSDISIPREEDMLNSEILGEGSTCCFNYCVNVVDTPNRTDFGYELIEAGSQGDPEVDMNSTLALGNNPPIPDLTLSTPCITRHMDVCTPGILPDVPTDIQVPALLGKDIDAGVEKSLSQQTDSIIKLSISVSVSETVGCSFTDVDARKLFEDSYCPF